MMWETAKPVDFLHHEDTYRSILKQMIKSLTHPEKGLYPDQGDT